jgi:hypothetical protein
MCEVTEVETEVVLEVVVVEEDMVGVNGKENLVLYFDCITYNTVLIAYKRNIPICQIISFCTG